MSKSKIHRRICDTCDAVAEVDENDPKMGGLPVFRGWFTLRCEGKNWMTPGSLADLCSYKCLKEWLKENYDDE